MALIAFWQWALHILLQCKTPGNQSLDYGALCTVILSSNLLFQKSRFNSKFRSLVQDGVHQFVVCFLAVLTTAAEIGSAHNKVDQPAMGNPYSNQCRITRGTPVSWPALFLRASQVVTSLSIGYNCSDWTKKQQEIRTPCNTAIPN